LITILSPYYYENDVLYVKVSAPLFKAWPKRELLMS